jgi:hypothetical protein
MAYLARSIRSIKSFFILFYFMSNQSAYLAPSIISIKSFFILFYFMSNQAAYLAPSIIWSYQSNHFLFYFMSYQTIIIIASIIKEQVYKKGVGVPIIISSFFKLSTWVSNFVTSIIIWQPSIRTLLSLITQVKPSSTYVSYKFRLVWVCNFFFIFKIINIKKNYFLKLCLNNLEKLRQN